MCLPGERIENGNAGGGEMRHVVGCHGEAMLKGGGGDLEIRTPVPNRCAHASPTSCGIEIERKNIAGIKCKEAVKPGRKRLGEIRIPLFAERDPTLNLTNGDDTHEDV